MIVIGVDPGIAILGYGVIEYKGNKFSAIDYGAITTHSDLDLPHRLKVVYDQLYRIIDKYKPQEFAIEELFFNKNVKTAMTIGHARGVAILSASNYGIPVYEYTPLQVKQGVVGYGRADKKQIQQMVKVLLGLKEIPKPDDVADALAIAMCHCHSGAMNKLLKI